MHKVQKNKPTCTKMGKNNIALRLPLVASDKLQRLKASVLQETEELKLLKDEVTVRVTLKVECPFFLAY